MSTPRASSGRRNGPTSPRFRFPASGCRRVHIVAKPTAPEAVGTVRGLAAWLAGRDITPVLEGPVAAETEWTGETVDREHLGDRCDLVVIVGGDGTLLSAARAMGERQAPILGVNAGNLGFLTKVPLDQLYPALEMTLRGEAGMDERSTLRAILTRAGSEVRRDVVVNDVVITGGAIARVIEIRIRTSHGFVATVLGDGVIVATPTGSTAYNLGAGGPVVHPAVEALILAPIIPLTLTQRPVVFPDNEELTLTLRTNPGIVHVTYDGQTSHHLEAGDVIRVRKSGTRLRLIALPDQNYFRVLRKKLLWSALPPKRAKSSPPAPPPEA